MGPARRLPELKFRLGRGRTRRLDPRGMQPAWELEGRRQPAASARRGAPQLRHRTPAGAGVVRRGWSGSQSPPARLLWI